MDEVTFRKALKFQLSQPRLVYIRNPIQFFAGLSRPFYHDNLCTPDR
jgi:hypothetical protein